MSRFLRIQLRSKKMAYQQASMRSVIAMLALILGNPPAAYAGSFVYSHTSAPFTAGYESGCFNTSQRLTVTVVLYTKLAPNFQGTVAAKSWSVTDGVNRFTGGKQNGGNIKFWTDANGTIYAWDVNESLLKKNKNVYLLYAGTYNYISLGGSANDSVQDGKGTCAPGSTAISYAGNMPRPWSQP